MSIIAIKDTRRLPTIVYLSLATLVLACCVFLAVGLNLNDQAEGLIYWNRDLTEPVSIWVLGTHSHAIFQSGVVDTMMTVLEGAAVFVAFVVGIWVRDLDTLTNLGLGEKDMRVIQLTRAITDFSQIGKWLTWAFFVAAGLSIFLVGTHYVAQVQGRGLGVYARYALALATGLATPGLIFMGMFCWLKIVQAVLVLLTMPVVQVPVGESSDAETNLAGATANRPAAAPEVRAAPAPNSGKNKKATGGQPQVVGHGVSIPPVGKAAIA